MEKQVNQGKVSNYVKKVASVCKTYDLISPGDKILVGVSGGKDSLFLLEALAYVKKKLRMNLTIHAVHVHVADAGYEINRTFLTDFCTALEIDLRFENVSVNLIENHDKGPCFVCSWHRRKRLFDLTRELECNKLALGHHMDDALETLFMNMMYHGSISSLPAKLKMFDGRIHLIRPLIELSQEDLMLIAKLQQYPSLKSECKFGGDTNRIQMRELLVKIKAMHHLAGKNMLRSMSRIFEEYLPVKSLKS